MFYVCVFFGFIIIFINIFYLLRLRSIKRLFKYFKKTLGLKEKVHLPGNL